MRELRAAERAGNCAETAEQQTELTIVLKSVGTEMDFHVHQVGGFVIARVWRGYTKPEHADAYESMLKPELLPGLSKAAGYRGSYLLRRAAGDEVEFVTIIVWESLDAVRAVAGPDIEKAVIPDERRQYLSRYDDKAAHYDIAAVHGSPHS